MALRSLCDAKSNTAWVTLKKVQVRCWYEVVCVDILLRILGVCYFGACERICVLA